MISIDKMIENANQLHKNDVDAKTRVFSKVVKCLLDSGIPFTFKVDNSQGEFQVDIEVLKSDPPQKIPTNIEFG